jgi:hypothetical protein
MDASVLLHSLFSVLTALVQGVQTLPPINL